MKVLYHIGEEVGSQTIMKKGSINTNLNPLRLEADDEIMFNNLHDIELYKLNGLGTMIRLMNGVKTVYLIVPRVFFNIGTGFVIVNNFATRKLKKLLEASQT